MIKFQSLFQHEIRGVSQSDLPQRTRALSLVWKQPSQVPPPALAGQNVGKLSFTTTQQPGATSIELDKNRLVFVQNEVNSAREPRGRN